MSMVRLFWLRWRLLLLMGVGLVASLGCGTSPPASFYTLSPLSTAEMRSGKETALRSISVGIGPIRLPQYLARKEIVTRTDANKIDLAEFDLWGGSLQDDFSRNLLENLSNLLADSGISFYLLPGTGMVDYRVGVDVIRFDGAPGGDVVLIANWTIRKAQGNEVVRVQNSRVQEPTTGKSYEAMVEGMSRALGRLSREIGEGIGALPR